MRAREIAGEPLDQPMRLVDVLIENLDHGSNVNVGVHVVPAVVVGNHRHRGVADFCLASEFGLGHVGHTDHVAAPATVKVALGARGKLRPLHDEIGTAACVSDLLRLGRGCDEIGQRRAHRIGHRHMRDAPRTEEALVARERAIDKLVDQHKMSGWKLLLQRSTGRHR
jgi:hypothetical protein